MAAQQNKPQEVTINLKAEVQKLKDMRDALELMKQDGKLANTNENTYKALFNQIEQSIKRMNEAIKDGAIGGAGLTKIQKGFESITSSLTKMITQEKSTGLGLKEYNTKLEEAEKNVRDQIAALEELKKKQKELLVTEKGNAKKGQEQAIMAAARQSSRGTRKGADTKAEALLKTGDLKAIKEGAAGGDAAATKALAMYNAELAKQTIEWQNLANEIEASKEQLNQYKATLNEVKSLGAYDEDAVAKLQEYSQTNEQAAEATRKTGEALKETGNAMANVPKNAINMDGALQKGFKTFIKFNVVLKTAKKMLKEGIEAVVDMDKALTDMSIVTGETRENLQQMIPTFNKLGRETGATTTEIASLTAEYMKQGRTMKDSLELAEQTAKAAKISGISTAESVQYMTSAINGFNLAAADAEHVSDVFAKLGATSATDYKDLAIALSKVSAQANSAGMSMEFTTAILAKGLETTQEAPESIGTALKTIVARMRELSDYGSTLEDGTSVNKVEKSLAAVGISLRDTSGQFRDLEEIFNELGPKWDSLNTMQQQAIAQSVAGTRQQSRFLAIMQDWDRTIELSNASLTAEGATMYQHSQYTKSLEYSINEMKTAWQGMISAITDSDLIRDVFNFIGGFLSKVTDVLNWLNEKSGGMVGTVVTLGSAFAIVVGWIKEIVTKVKAAQELKEKQLKAQERHNELLAKQLGLENEIKEAANDTSGKEKELGLLETINQKWTEIRDKAKAYGAEVAKNAAKSFKDGVKEARQKAKQRAAEKAAAKAAQKLEKQKQKLEKKAAKELQKNIKKYKVENDEVFKAKDAAFLKEQQADSKHLLTLGQENVLETAQVGLNEVQNQQLDEQVDKKNAGVGANMADTATELVKQEVEEEITEEKGQQNQEGSQSVVTNTIETGIEAAKKETEEEITEEKVKQNVTDNAGLPTLITKLMLTISTAIANAASAIGSMVGSPFGIAALALLATAGLATATVAIGNAAGAKQTEKANEKAEEANNKAYENELKKDEIRSNAERYKELMTQSTRTADENKELNELRKSLEEAGVNLSGNLGDLDQAVQDTIVAIDADTAAATEEAAAAAAAAAKVTVWEALWDKLGDLFSFIGEKFAAFRDAIVNAIEGIKNFGKELYEGAKKVPVIGPIIQGVENVVGGVKQAFTNFKNWVKRSITDEEEAKEQANAIFTNDAQQLNFKNQQNAKLAEKMRAEGASEEDIAKAQTQLTNAMNSLDWESMADEAYKNGFVLEDGSIDVQGYMDTLGDQLINANNTLMNAASESLADRIDAYNEAASNMSSDIAKGAFDNQNYELQLLQGSSDAIRGLRGEDGNDNQHITDDAILSIAQTANSLGIAPDSSALSNAIASMGSTGDFAALMKSMYDGSYFEQNGLGNMSEEDRKKFINSITSAGVGFNSVEDKHTSISSTNDKWNDIGSRLQNGELTDEDKKALRDEYGDLYLSEKFQNASGIQQRKMLEDARKEQMNKELEGINNQEAALLAEREYATDERKAQIDAELDALHELREEVVSLGQDYARYSEETAKQAASDALINSLQEQIDAGTATKKVFEDMAAELDRLKGDKLKQLTTSLTDLGDLSGKDLSDAIDLSSGKAVVNYDKLVGLEEELVNKILEEADAYNAVLEQQDALAEAERERQIDIQNQAIAAMQARLDAEYEATQKSLDKRRDLYNKYFDELDAEAETEDYENDRQALLNKIASLSTATDSDSLAKLKEAQEALADLDDEKLSSDREMRREAVEGSFDQQGEQLDVAYESAMSDVQGMWEEFCTMAGEDQLALFQQYGEGFQEVTDLQKQMAMETLDATMEAIASYGFVGVTPTPKPAYAEGGLVDFTGPAWVDGSKTKPEAFLDPEDTANIGALAQGLRAMVNNIFSPKEEAKSVEDVSTLNIEEFNINVGLAGNMIETGRDVADGFMKAIRELGININKKG